jgi:hypothetical protein
MKRRFQLGTYYLLRALALSIGERPLFAGDLGTFAPFGIFLQVITHPLS